MCDKQTLKDWEDHLETRKVTRRKFNRLTAGAGLAATLPTGAFAQRLSSGPMDVLTPDGVADCYLSHAPNGEYPGVILWPEVLGLRPTFTDMARRLAGYGYTVLAVNPYCREAKAPVVSRTESFSDPAVRDRIVPMAQKLNAESHFTDARAMMELMERHRAVTKTRKMATIGYCMGGPMVMRTAAAGPDKIAAAATFHGARMATDEANSPHLLIPERKAGYLVAIAENDDQAEPQAKTMLRDAFDAAGLNAEVEVYEGAQHGWTVPGSAAYDMDLSKRAWSRLIALLKEATA
jgi:carboxymethylenebutenolidase